jgi:hypothetical protein
MTMVTAMETEIPSVLPAILEAHLILDRLGTEGMGTQTICLRLAHCHHRVLLILGHLGPEAEEVVVVMEEAVRVILIQHPALPMERLYRPSSLN